jgi:hypothetical protein
VKILKSIHPFAWAGLLACSFSSSGIGGEAFDGIWRVNATTKTQDSRCKDRSFSLVVESGLVQYFGPLSALASGKVDSQGAVVAKIGRIRVGGALSEGSGMGKWHSPNCTGSWTAHRGD